MLNITINSLPPFLWGLASSLAFAPTYLFFIFFFSFNFLLTNLERGNSNGSVKDDSRNSIYTNNAKNFILGYYFGFGYFIGNCYWYCHSLLIEPLKYLWFIPLAITTIPTFLAIYCGSTTFLTGYGGKFISNRFLRSVAFSLFWAISEYLRGVLLGGFPWNLLGYSMGFSPLAIQTVSILGSHGYGFFLALIYSSYWVLKDKNYRNYTAIYALLLLFAFVYGYKRLEDIDSGEQATDYKYGIRLVQPNISLENKHNGDGAEEELDMLLNMSLESLDENIKYIVWPESALPYPLDGKSTHMIAEFLASELPSDVALLTGAIRFDEKSDQIFNSLAIFRNGNLIDYYDKRKLVPFGEFIPLRSFLPFIRTLAAGDDLSSSKAKAKTFKIDDLLAEFSPIICYEAIFPSLPKGWKNKGEIEKNKSKTEKNSGGDKKIHKFDAKNDPQRLIINITNDAWFGKTSGPYQHFDTLKFRALEQNAMVLRVANSGISGVIDRFGRVLMKTKLGERTVLDVEMFR